MIIDYDRSIVEVILDHAKAKPDQTALVFDQGNGPVSEYTYAELAAEVRRMSGALVERGLAGRQIALLFAAGAEFVIAMLSCLAAGSVAVPLAPIGRRRARLQNLLEMLHAQTPDCLLLDRTMAGLFGGQLAMALEPSSVDYLEYDWLDEAIAGFEPGGARPGDIAILQYTSGTTSNPKGVMITHGNIIANETMIRHAFGHDEHSGFVGWVPHYHDQGLFGNILQPLFLGSQCVLTSPAAFVNKPMSWLELISQYRAHSSGGPNFGYDLCVESAMRKGIPDIDLSSWRVAFNGAERVHPTTLRRFAECFAAVGFDERAFLPCYGLAESTLVTIARPHWSGGLARRFDSDALSGGIAIEADATTPQSLELTCCGPAMTGGDAVIVEQAGTNPLPHGRVGEIWLRGPHIAIGYLGRPDASRETFGAHLDSGEGPFLRTGDLGFSTPDGFYIVGRLKDVINLRGRKYAPSDVERIWSTVSAQVGQASAAAIQIEVGNRQHICLIAEAKRTSARKIDADFAEGRAQELRARAMEILELGITDLIFVPEGAIPRTTSGKVQRKKAGEMVLSGEIVPIAIAGPLGAVLATRPIAAAASAREDVS